MDLQMPGPSTFDLLFDACNHNLLINRRGLVVYKIVVDIAFLLVLLDHRVVFVALYGDLYGVLFFWEQDRLEAFRNGIFALDE